MSGFHHDEHPEQTSGDLEQLLLDAEAKWSLRDDEGAAATLERALALVWGRPDEVLRVSEIATRLVGARPSEALARFARRAAEGAEALDVSPTRSAGQRDAWTKTRQERRRGRLGLVQLAVFTVVLVVLVVQYLEAVR
ncbi:MAG: hypothetical protein M3Q67_00125 [Actinomycetota bacterium]|nr:hypothetical protein [Actinomycetota bacterium]